jgi:DNA-binding CsgD family transcriptional regulator
MSAGKVLLDLYDRMKCGAVLLDPSGSVLRFNAAAERCLTRHNGSIDPPIRLEPQQATRMLQQLLGGTTRLEALPQAPRPLRSRGERPLIAYARPYPGPEGQEAALLVLLDLDECLEPDAALLQEVFGLTKAEARLAMRLACGETLEDIAEEHDISISTARGQLKSVFAKTGASRQAELVVLLNRLAALV